MSAINVDFVIDQGEDWTCQLSLTDERDAPYQLKHPFRMDLIGATHSVVFTFQTVDDPAEDEIPSIILSNASGVVQLHMTSAETDLLYEGAYPYDLFGTVTDGGIYAGDQVVRFLTGRVFVNQRITEEF